MSLRELLMVYYGDFIDIHDGSESICCAIHSWNMLSEDVLNRGVRSVKPCRSDTIKVFLYEAEVKNNG